MMQLPIEYSLLDIIGIIWPWIVIVVLVVSWEWYKRKRLGKEKVAE